jgi:hypothetical protein
MARFHVSPSASNEQHRLLAGVQAGVAANIQMGHWTIQPAFVFSQKGSWSRNTQTLTPEQGPPITYQEKNTNRIPYLELPLHIAYTPGWARGAHIFAGPYVGIGLGGYSEIDPDPVTINGYTLERHRSQWTSPTLLGGTGTIRWEDVGLNAGLGYQRGKWLLQAQQSFGFTNVWPDTHSGQNARRSHRVTSLTVTYLFGGRPTPN